MGVRSCRQRGMCSNGMKSGACRPAFSRALSSAATARRQRQPGAAGRTAYSCCCSGPACVQSSSSTRSDSLMTLLPLRPMYRFS